MKPLTYRLDGEKGFFMGNLYIAYGSNLNLEQMAARCPYATVYGVGQLNNWELIYRGARTNAHATIRRSKGNTVPVLVWEISDYDECRLDRYEGYPIYYIKKDIMVDIGGKKKKAMVYIMDESRHPGRPSPLYIQTIRQGYIDNNLDIDYFNKSLETNSIECNCKL